MEGQSGPESDPSSWMSEGSEGLWDPRAHWTLSQGWLSSDTKPQNDKQSYLGPRVELR